MEIILMIIVGIFIFFKVVIPLIEWIMEIFDNASFAVSNVKEKTENMPSYHEAEEYVKNIRTKYSKYSTFHANQYHLPSRGCLSYESNEQVNFLISELMNCINETSSYSEVKKICIDVDMLRVKLSHAKFGKYASSPSFDKNSESIFSESFLYLSAIDEYGLVGEKKGDTNYSYNLTKNFGGGYYYYLKCEKDDVKNRYDFVCEHTPPRLRVQIPQLQESIEPIKEELRVRIVEQLKDNYKNAGNDKTKLQEFINLCQNNRKEVRDGVSEEYVNACMSLEKYKDAIEYEHNAYPFVFVSIEKYKEYKNTMNQPDFQEALKYAKTAKEIIAKNNQIIESSLMNQIDEIIEEENDPVSSLSILDLLNQE